MRLESEWYPFSIERTSFKLVKVVSVVFSVRIYYSVLVNSNSGSGSYNLLQNLLFF